MARRQKTGPPAVNACRSAQACFLPRARSASFALASPDGTGVSLLIAKTPAPGFGVPDHQPVLSASVVFGLSLVHLALYCFLAGMTLMLLVGWVAEGAEQWRRRQARAEQERSRHDQKQKQQQTGPLEHDLLP